MRDRIHKIFTFDMGFRTWRRVCLISLWLSMLMTIFCVTPGPGLWLANQKPYITLISHIALVLALMGVLAAIRAEGKAADS